MRLINHNFFPIQLNLHNIVSSVFILQLREDGISNYVFQTVSIFVRHSKIRLNSFIGNVHFLILCTLKLIIENNTYNLDFYNLKHYKHTLYFILTYPNLLVTSFEFIILSSFLLFIYLLFCYCFHYFISINIYLSTQFYL